MESHLEARLWAEVFAFAEQACGIEPGTIRATVLIETIWAAFEMDEILYELRDYIAGLNAGRWDYLFSIVKTFRDAGTEYVLPDRNTITMAAPFMKAYSDLLVRPATGAAPTRSAAWRPSSRPAGTRRSTPSRSPRSGRTRPGRPTPVRGILGGAPGSGADLPGDLRRRAG